jgi:hypothetical protein
MSESERNNLHVFLQVGTLKVFTSRHAEPLVQVAIQGVESQLLTAEAHRGLGIAYLLSRSRAKVTYRLKAILLLFQPTTVSTPPSHQPVHILNP